VVGESSIWCDFGSSAGPADADGGAAIAADGVGTACAAAGASLPEVIAGETLAPASPDDEGLAGTAFARVTAGKTAEEDFFPVLSAPFDETVAEVVELVVSEFAASNLPLGVEFSMLRASGALGLIPSPVALVVAGTLSASGEACVPEEGEFVCSGKTVVSFDCPLV
jgi:hypothetical protein